MIDPVWYWALTGSVVLVTVVGYVHPVTRPYFRKWGWLAIVPVAFLVGVAVASGRRKGARTPALPDGAGAAVTDLAGEAMARAARADADLVRARLEARTVDDASVARLAAFDDAVRHAEEVEDPRERRARLIKIVEGS